PGKESAMARLPKTADANAVRDSTDGAGVLDAARSQAQGTLHESDCDVALGCERVDRACATASRGAGTHSSGTTARKIGLVAGVHQRSEGVVRMARSRQRRGGIRESPGDLSKGRQDSARRVAENEPR